MSAGAWWIVGGLIWAAAIFWVWCCCRVAAKADRDWDEIVAKLDAEERQRRENEGA